MNQRIETVIIGAGLTGLAAAYQLESAGYFDYRIFEQECTPGGLCRSVLQDGFIFDYTGHLLHATAPAAQQLINQTLGFKNCVSQERQSFIYSNEQVTRYPFQMNLHALPISVIADCIEGFVKRRAPNNRTISNKSSFYSWVQTNFGSGFGKHFFFPYQEKIFCYPVRRLSATWTGRFVPATSLHHIIQGAINPYDNKNVGYNARFYYPAQGGIQRLIEGIVTQLINPISYQIKITAINLNNQTIQLSDGSVIQYKKLISTMPLKALCAMICDRSDTVFNHAHRQLLASSVLNINVGVSRRDWTDKHWIYVPEPIYHFYRIGFPHNLTPAMAPHEHSSLALECAYRDTIPADTVAKAIAQAKHLLHIADHEIATVNILDLPCAYVTYNRRRDEVVPVLLARLKENGIYSIGRYGSWKYASMQEAIIEGIDTAQELLTITQQSSVGWRQRPLHNRIET